MRSRCRPIADAAPYVQIEDWETAQNYVHSPSLYHRVSTAWADTKGGFRFYNFPWQLGLFFLSLLAWGGAIIIFREALVRYTRSGSARRS